MGFAEGCEVVVKQTDEENWEVRAPIGYQGRSQSFAVDPGAETDFASIPRPFVWFLPRYGPYTKAAILHDHLWRKCATAGSISWRDADGIFRRAMRELGVAFLRRWIMWGAVRVASIVKIRRSSDVRDWLLTLPGALLFLAVAAPVVVPAAVPILLGLAVFWLMEAIVFLPLKAFELLQRRFGRAEAKPVHAPTFELKLASGSLKGQQPPGAPADGP